MACCLCWFVGFVGLALLASWLGFVGFLALLASLGLLASVQNRRIQPTATANFDNEQKCKRSTKNPNGIIDYKTRGERNTDFPA